jgi:cold shock protein
VAVSVSFGIPAEASPRRVVERSCRLGLIWVLFLGVVEMPQGTIKKLVADRGFGFIEGERGDIFFHHSDVQDTAIEDLSIGQAVEYEVGQGPKGPRAENVRVVE